MNRRAIRFAASGALCVVVLLGCKRNPQPAAAPDISPAADLSAAADNPVVAMPDLTPPDAPIVTVNSQTLTRAEARMMTARMLRAQGAPEEQMEQILAQMGNQLQARVVEQFVASTLLKAEAARRQIAVTDADVTAVLSNLTARLPPGVAIEQALAGSGMTLDDLKRDIRDNESIRKLHAAETTQVAVPSDVEVAAYYAANAEQFTRKESTHARHILIGCKDDADAAAHAAAKAKIDGLRQQLMTGGADFAALAKANSDCPSAKEGGDLGTFGRGQMVPAFDAAAFSLETNVVSEVVQTPFGYHLIQVLERLPGETMALEKVSPQIRENLQREASGKVFQQFIDGLREKAEIVYAPGAAPAPAAPMPLPME
jgi:peptidyl-prolyl cis-trans isomerase C